MKTLIIELTHTVHQFVELIMRFDCFSLLTFLGKTVKSGHVTGARFLFMGCNTSYAPHMTSGTSIATYSQHRQQRAL